MSLAKFEKEPLTDVVFGVEFDPSDFTSVHFGLYWQTIRGEFPNLPLDRPPVGGIEIFTPLPSLRRVWFESENKKQLIQLQSNRFYYNWRRQSPKEDYPHYEEIFPLFIEEWNKFQEWWEKESGQTVKAIRYELTYLNQIDEELGWNRANDYQKVFGLISHSWAELPLEPKTLNARIEFMLPNNSGDLIVNVDQSIQPDTNLPVVVLNLTAGSRDTSTDIEAWFEAAHDSIVSMFISIVSQQTKKDWGLKWLK
jgi:uncharacterized protein (TIGR04255 family)